MQRYASKTYVNKILCYFPKRPSTEQWRVSEGEYKQQRIRDEVRRNRWRKISAVKAGPLLKAVFKSFFFFFDHYTFGRQGRRRVWKSLASAAQTPLTNDVRVQNAADEGKHGLK